MTFSGTSIANLDFLPKSTRSTPQRQFDFVGLLHLHELADMSQVVWTQISTQSSRLPRTTLTLAVPDSTTHRNRSGSPPRLTPLPTTTARATFQRGFPVQPRDRPPPLPSDTVRQAPQPPWPPAVPVLSEHWWRFGQVPNLPSALASALFPCSSQDRDSSVCTPVPSPP